MKLIPFSCYSTIRRENTKIACPRGVGADAMLEVVAPARKEAPFPKSYTPNQY